MEISRDTVLWVVKAARMSVKLAEDFRPLLADPVSTTVPDMIADFLKDALSNMAGERLTMYQDFDEDSMIPKLLRSDKHDGDIADIIIAMDKGNSHPEMPKPNLVSRDEFFKLLNKYGGYKATPEGEW